MHNLLNVLFIIYLPFIVISQRKVKLNCIVNQYRTINSDNIETPIDTTVNQKRLINIYKNDSVIEIGFQFSEEKKELIFIKYYLISAKDTAEYKQYLLTTDDYFPLTLLVNEVYNTAYLYYFWSSNENKYLKSEKLEIISREIN